ncbi:MAG TPA: SRPBCC family protein [Allosphingosinicella sp.]|uniref:SRPBCC family protein n=1 Tax=Allosphingosinicella sp. TaxID=2823234 RepID=UPI002ED898E7
MTQDQRTLPEGAGTTSASNDTTTTYYPTEARGRSTSSTYTPGASQRSAFASEEYSSAERRDLVVTERSSSPNRATVVGAAVAGAVLGAALPFMLSGRSSSRSKSETAVAEESIIINRPARELYDFWRDFTNFPQFMDNIKSVEKLDEKRSHWVIKAPAGTSVEFDSFITEDVPGRVIAWRSEEDASVPNRGRVEFIETSNGQATNVRTTISYDPPAGAAGRLVAKLFHREPQTQAREDLQRFKDLMEGRRS